jgi:hypothetical protein
MKTIFIWCLASLLVAGCSKKDSDSATPDPSTTNSEMKATVAGSPAFTAVGDISVVNGVRINSTDPEDAPARLVLRGIMDGGNTNIILTLIKFTGAGTYIVKADPDATIGTSLATYSENHLNGPFYYSQYMAPAGTTVGQVVVTSFDAATKHIQGTFSFTGSTPPSSGTPHTKQVTNGTFSVYDIGLY